MKHAAAPIVLSTVLGLAVAAGCLGAPDEPAGETPPAPTATTPPPPAGRPVPPAPTPESTPPAANPTPPIDTPTTPPPPTTMPPAPTSPPSAGGGPGDYACNLVIGIQSTGQWYKAGFEKLVDDSKWEVISVHSAKVELWADPKNKLWASKPSSPCATNADNPDRILFTVLNWVYTDVNQWVPQIVASVKNLKARYPGVKRIELRTFIRAPGNKPCPGKSDYKSYIKDSQDVAHEMVAAMFPDLVTVAPKLEVRSCGDFGNNAPHFTGGGAEAAAKIMADAYGAGTPVP